MAVLIDTNIIIDALTARNEWSPAAQELLLLASAGELDAYITATSATDIYYLIRKHQKSEVTARESLSVIARSVGILDVLGADCITALYSEMKDYEDSVLSLCAKRNRMQYIITRNINDFKNAPVQAILPERFLAERNR